MLEELVTLSYETEWVEFKENNADPEEIGQYISAISNSAALHSKQVGYIVWGIQDGNNRIQTIREIQEQRGYAAGFEGIISYINSQLPQNEVINEAFRTQSRMYPEIAIRELVANAIIHQNFIQNSYCIWLLSFEFYLTVI